METAELSEQVLKQIGSGDVQAFEHLYGVFSPKLFRYLRLRIKSENEIQDIMQETFVAVWNRAGQFRGDSSPSTWVFGIARHKLLDWLRRKERVYDREYPSLDEGLLAASLVAPKADVETRLTWSASLDALAEPWKELAYLVFVEELAYRDIAEVLGIPEGTVKSRVFSLKSHLRMVFGDEKGVSQNGAHVRRSAISYSSPTQR